ncbi:FkbM family methyltransferase [Inhella sp.]|uniref:FkbM family methyltransferase n=1 Tax=Inhella sp. TaxID=1921806 RepID=UPI0035AE7C57
MTVEPIHIFGAGLFARALAKALQAQGRPVAAFLVSGAPPSPQIDDLPCRTLQAQDLEAAPLWIAAFNHRHDSDYGLLQVQLLGLNPHARLVWPQEAFGQVAQAMGFRYWLHPVEDYSKASSEIAAARARLEDEDSRRTLDDIIRFRSVPGCFAMPPRPDPDTQYLPSWLRAALQASGRSQLRIVDGGAYQGETLRELNEIVPIAHAWAFEPDPANFKVLAKQQWDYPVECIAAGLSDAEAQLSFSDGVGEASSISEAGALKVRVCAVDEVLTNAEVNFIKLDIEGHELQALQGARRTLLRCRPALAIAAYHRWDDLWQLSSFIASLGLGYRMRLSVHQHNSFETVLFAY